MIINKDRILKIVFLILFLYSDLFADYQVINPDGTVTTVTTGPRICESFGTTGVRNHEGTGICNGNLNLQVPLYFSGVGAFYLSYNSTYAPNFTQSISKLGAAKWEFAGAGIDLRMKQTGANLLLYSVSSGIYETIAKQGTTDTYLSIYTYSRAMFIIKDSSAIEGRPAKQLYFSDGSSVIFSLYPNGIYFPDKLIFAGQENIITYANSSNPAEISRISSPTGYADFSYTGGKLNKITTGTSSALDDYEYEYSFEYDSDKLITVTGKNSEGLTESYAMKYENPNGLISTFSTPLDGCKLADRKFIFYQGEPYPKGIIDSEFARQYYGTKKVFKTDESDYDYVKYINLRGKDSLNYVYGGALDSSFSRYRKFEYESGRVIRKDAFNQPYIEEFNNGKVARINDGDVSTFFEYYTNGGGVGGGNEFLPAKISLYHTKNEAMNLFQKNLYWYVQPGNRIQKLSVYLPNFEQDKVQPKLSNNMEYTYTYNNDYLPATLITKVRVNAGTLSTINTKEFNYSAGVLSDITIRNSYGNLSRKFSYGIFNGLPTGSIARFGSAVYSDVGMSQYGITSVKDYISGEEISSTSGPGGLEYSPFYSGKSKATFDIINNQVAVQSAGYNSSREYIRDFFGFYVKNETYITPDDEGTFDYIAPSRRWNNDEQCNLLREQAEIPRSGGIR